MLERYLSQIRLPEVGTEGQRKLSRSRVLVVGAGGLSSIVLPYLVGAGVGTEGGITLVDGDRVDESNLHRQILYQSNDLGRLKVEAARERLFALNPTVKLEVIPKFLDSELAQDLALTHDLIMDGTDRAEVKGSINEASLATGTPWIYASITAWDGLLSVFQPRRSPLAGCFACLFPKKGTSLGGACTVDGVLGPVVGIMGSLQATEALKLLIGHRSTLEGHLLTLDARNLTFQRRRLPKNPSCPACGISKVGENAAPRKDPQVFQVTPDFWRESFSPEKHLLIDVREPNEIIEFTVSDSFSMPLSSIAPQNPKPLCDLKDALCGRIPVFFCRSGQRAEKAAFLLKNEFSVPVGVIRGPGSLIQKDSL